MLLTIFQNLMMESHACFVFEVKDITNLMHILLLAILSISPLKNCPSALTLSTQTFRLFQPLPLIYSISSQQHSANYPDKAKIFMSFSERILKVLLCHYNISKLVMHFSISGSHAPVMTMMKRLMRSLRLYWCLPIVPCAEALRLIASLKVLCALPANPWIGKSRLHHPRSRGAAGALSRPRAVLSGDATVDRAGLETHL